MSQRATVERARDTVNFFGGLNAGALQQAIAKIADVLADGHDDIRLDFSRITSAYTEGAVPLVAFVEWCRDQGILFSIVLPERAFLRDLFINTNWAFFLADGDFWRANIGHRDHLATQKFSSAQEQKLVVDALLDVTLRRVKLPRSHFQALEWSVNEIMDNVINHSGAGAGFVQATAMSEALVFTVADSGMGILKSLRQGFPRLQDDLEALDAAVKRGVTRDKEVGQGNGLAGTRELAVSSGGTLEIISGRGVLRLYEEGGASRAHRHLLPATVRYPGTAVSVLIARTEREALYAALNATARLGGSFDRIDEAYTDDDDSMLLRLVHEEVGTGTRAAGRELRTKAMNLLGMSASKLVVIDWKGVDVVSSSFADEFVGKLHRELGSDLFQQRVRMRSVNELVSRLLSAAIRSRSQEDMTATTL
jgi:anti-sigma regulatory factor (Ser/Thr protein kinase)